MFARRYPALLIVAVLASSLALLAPRAAQADMAPLPSAGGSDLAPGPSTQVAMVAEKVVIDIQAEMPADFQAAALVTADFTLRNLGAAAENIEVRFPLGLPTLRAGEIFSDREAQDLRAVVDGVETPTRRQDFDGAAWAVWPMHFAPGEDVHVRVSYRVVGIDGPTYNTFFYILETGAGWRGPIGQGDVIVRFPYAADPEVWLRSPEADEALPADDYYQGHTPPFVVEGHELRWHFSELEPTGQDNVRLTVLNPPLWQAVLDARQQAAEKPDDPAAQLRLGEAYHAAIPMKHGWFEPYPFQQRFGDLAHAALSKAVQLAPSDPAAHAAYAMFLAERSWSQEPEPYYTQAKRELEQARALGAPAEDLAPAQGILDLVEQFIITTPTPDPTSAPTATPAPGARLAATADAMEPARVVGATSPSATPTPAERTATAELVGAAELVGTAELAGAGGSATAGPEARTPVTQAADRPDAQREALRWPLPVAASAVVVTMAALLAVRGRHNRRS